MYGACKAFMFEDLIAIWASWRLEIMSNLHLFSIFIYVNVELVCERIRECWQSSSSRTVKWVVFVF